MVPVKMEESELKTEAGTGGSIQISSSLNSGRTGSRRPTSEMSREQISPREAVGERMQNQRKDPSWDGDWRTMVLRPRWDWNKAETCWQSQLLSRPWPQARGCMFSKERFGLTEDFPPWMSFYTLYYTIPRSRNRTWPGTQKPPSLPPRKTLRFSLASPIQALLSWFRRIPKGSVGWNREGGVCVCVLGEGSSPFPV